MTFSCGLLLGIIATLVVTTTQDPVGFRLAQHSEIFELVKDDDSPLTSIQDTFSIRESYEVLINKLEKGHDCLSNALKYRYLVGDKSEDLNKTETGHDFLSNVLKYRYLVGDKSEDLNKTETDSGDTTRDSGRNSTEVRLPANYGLPSPDMLIDIAPGKRVHASSVYNSDYPPEKAIDYNDGSMAITSKDQRPWWMIDLGLERVIYHIMILSRQDCCPDRLQDLEIRLGNELHLDGDFSSHDLLYLFKGPYKKDDRFLMYTFINGVKGRYLSLQMVKDEAEYLQINTVKVIALRN